MIKVRQSSRIRRKGRTNLQCKIHWLSFEHKPNIATTYYYKHQKDYNISGSGQLDPVIGVFELLKSRTLKMKLSAGNTSTALTQHKHQD